MVMVPDAGVEQQRVVDVSVLEPDCGALIEEAARSGVVLVITRDGEPLADIWQYEPSPFALVGFNDRGEWAAEPFEDAEDDFDEVIDLARNSPSIAALATALCESDRQVLITKGQEWLAVLGRHQNPADVGSMSAEEWRELKREMWRELPSVLDGAAAVDPA